MIAVILALSLASADPLDHALVISGQPLGTAQTAPVLDLLSAKPTSEFLAPLVRRLNARRATVPTARLAAIRAGASCPGVGSVLIVVDMAAYLTDLADSVTRDRLGVVQDLGTADMDTLTVCLTPWQGKLRIEAVATMKAWHGVLGALSGAQAMLGRVPEAFYSVAEAQLDIPAVLEWGGKSRTRPQALLRALSGFIDQDLEATVVRPLTGHVLAALAVVGRGSVHVFELGGHDTRGAEEAVKKLVEFAPEAPLPAHAPAHSVGVDVGLATLSPSMPLFIRVEPKQLLLASEGNGLFAHWKSGVPTAPAVAALLVDLGRYASLYARVGRPVDTLEMVHEWGAGAWVDDAHPPPPAALLNGMKTLRAVVSKTGTQLRLDATISR